MFLIYVPADGGGVATKLNKTAGPEQDRSGKVLHLKKPPAVHRETNKQGPALVPIGAQVFQ